MAIRIDRIKVNRGGPLGSDFEFEPGDLNLVYGHNESGKTYVVESLIKFLFSTNSRAPIDWNLRDWEIAGSAVVTGVENDPVSFTKTSKKLEDYWEEGTGLPPDFSRLLVVRAGETLLVKDEKDSVGRDILKDYLSGEGLLDKIADRISATIRDATVQDHLINGHQRGELKDRREYETHLRRLQALLEKVEEGYASGDAYSLRQKKEAVEVDLKKLEKAKRYYAAQLNGQIQDLDGEKREFPAEEELSKLELDVRDYESTTVAIETKSEKLEELEGTSDDYKWTEKALGVYQEIINGIGDSGSKPVFMFLSLFFLVGAVITGLLGRKIPLILCVAGSAVFLVLYYMETKKALTRVGARTELEKLKAEFQDRFGSELTGKAAIQVKFEELKENYILAIPLKKEVDELTARTRSIKKNVSETLKAWTGVEQSGQNWRDTIGELKAKMSRLEDKIRSLERKLDSAGVPEEEYLDKDPGEEWNPGRHATVTEDLRSTEQARSEEEDKLERLKGLLSQETGLASSDWEELITDLRDKREATAQDYRQLTANILAKVQVNAVIQEFREQENSRIAEGLKGEELTEPLHALTGRYKGIRLEEDRGLVLVTDEDEDYALSAISTGAREQAFLALRMGFASIAMEGKTAFLILDDAFQHSDWNRRKNLIAQTLNFVKKGWQVFYFTMDDHIRDLFQDAGEKIGDGFRCHELT